MFTKIKPYLKYIPWVLVVIGLCFTTFYYWNSGRRYEALLTARNTELQQANLELGRAKTTIGDATLTVKRLEKAIQKEIADRKAIVSLYAELEAEYKIEKLKKKTVTRIVYQDREIDLPTGKLFVKLDDGTYKNITSLTYNYKDFRIFINGDAIKQEISYKLNQKFKAVLVESKVPSGAVNHYASLYELDENGKTIGKLKLTNFTVIKSPELPPKFMWWNPKLDLMAGGGITHKLGGFWSADIGLSIVSYGTTPNDIYWKFPRIGVGLVGGSESGFAITLSPVQYNIGKNLPLISNLWLSPYGGYDFINQVGVFGLGISVVF